MLEKFNFKAFKFLDLFSRKHEISHESHVLVYTRK